MPEPQVNLYEGLFLLEQNASVDLNSGVQHVNEILGRAEAEVIALSKWDDRKLAYKVKNQRRGVYLLAHFKAASNRLAQIERDCNLSEKILRNMVLRAEHVGEVELEQAKKDAEQLQVEVRLRDETESAPAQPEAEATVEVKTAEPEPTEVAAAADATE